MPADRQFVLYHLIPSTPPSWIIDDRSEPKGRLLTCELEICQGSPHGKENRTWKRVWVHPDLDTQQADALETQYPKPDRSDQLARIMDKLLPTNR